MKQIYRLIAIGMVMGAAEVVPGVSGGTIAFVTGIYERLVNAIQTITPMLIRDFKNPGMVWKKIDGNFLSTLFASMVVSILLFANGLIYLLEHHAIFIWSFFFGLVMGSVWLVIQQISRIAWDIAFIMVAGSALGFALSSLVPIEVEPSLLYVFLGGAIAVCAWILPGLSGSFVLLILGLYRYVIEAVRNLDLVVILTLATGCAIGIVSFSRLVARLFKGFRDETLALLTGFMVGSLVKLWPWRHTLSYQIKADGSPIPVVQEPILPSEYSMITGTDPEFVMAGVGLLLGCFAVLGLHFLSKMETGHFSRPFQR